mmetsp:Transcript_25476/g.61237  ORF Transcript_25476/g.61237 Transcript_25476/m.61237 type:complete len:272 (+) Transcript_25476:97-912(+)|eukprot:CAMPEP_0181096514 /NCGR_PEP_ID=MMETSP1071-20121207/11076_1 /TAXON_ID=35127 /ORGANISM="Thalassiosira sp., Strain NH16" /LENGTH=271 /DNA_ID=CAMNT_0023178933 /DNA_START=80 /DNA_END=895 /DNA_ORIENTATION=+
MEMTKKPASQPGIPRSPFSSSAEREELERALLTSTGSSDCDSASQNVVPTAVPIVAGDTFDESSAPVMAVASSFPGVASLPRPPPSTSETVASRRTKATAHYKKSANFDKSESFAEDDVIVRSEPPSYNEYDFPLPTASVLPTHTSNFSSSEQLTTSTQLRAANVRGGISSEEEIVDVERAQRMRSAIHYHTDEAVKAANANAARKAGTSDEGLTVDEGIHHLDSKVEEKEEDDDVKPYGTGKGGYEVENYDVADYDTSEYDVAEYKSVYE